MLQEKMLRCELSFAVLEIRIQPVGRDLQILVQGGEIPHIGCVVLAVPRPSLTGDGSISCTSSVLNVTGHKDEGILRGIAERVCKKYNAVTVCSGGFHMDNMKQTQIRELVRAVSVLEL